MEGKEGDCRGPSLIEKGHRGYPRLDEMRKIPVIDIGACIDCDSCIEICPSVFRRNSETGYIEVVDLPGYPDEDVQEAINICPVDCITWEEVP